MRYGPRPDAPRGAWRLVRGSVVVVACWLAIGLILTTASLVALIMLRIGVTRWFHRVTHLCGRAVLGLAGIRLVVENGERLAGRRARLIVFNHGSQLDMFIWAALIPPGGTAIGKRELLFIPFIGWAAWAFRIPMVDRSSLEKARPGLRRAARLITEEQASVLIAPEGTRSRDGRLGPFKMGAFHLAQETRAPLLPVILRGAKECQPMGRIIPDPGVIEVCCLPEIDTSGFTEETLHAERDRLRELFVRELGEDALVGLGPHDGADGDPGEDPADDV